MTDSPDSGRRQERAPIELRVEYKRLNSFFADYTRNISKGGTFIRTERPLGIGTAFVFELHVPHLAQPLRLQGRVQWVADGSIEGDEPGMGIGFVYESEADRHRIESIVDGLMVESLGSTLHKKLLGRDDP